jgi:hypothetical protein
MTTITHAQVSPTCDTNSFQTSFARSFVAVTVGGAIIAALSAALGLLAAS